MGMFSFLVLFTIPSSCQTVRLKVLVAFAKVVRRVRWDVALR